MPPPYTRLYRGAAANDKTGTNARTGADYLNAVIDDLNIAAPRFRVNSATVTAQPASPAERDAYILPSGKTGAAWGGMAVGAIAAYQNGAWREIAAAESMSAYVRDVDTELVHTGAAWVEADQIDVHVSAANKVLGSTTAAGVVQEIDFTATARQLCDDTSFAAMCATLGAAQLAASNTHSGALNTFQGSSWTTVQIRVAADGAWAQFKGQRARGNLGAPTAVQAGDTIYSFTPEAHDGTSFVQAGGFDFIAETNFNSAKSTYWRLATVQSGTWAERLRVTAAGDFGVGKSPSIKLDVDGPVRVKSYTVATVPAASFAGCVIYVSNEAGGAVIAFSDGANWRRVTDRAIIS